MDDNIECDGFVFYRSFDSANLARVEPTEVSRKTNNDSNDNDNKNSKNAHTDDVPSYGFDIWTKHDCHGTEFQNTNRTWFYFGIKAPKQGVYVKLNIINLNKQVKMFSQGMSPVYKTIPGHPQWERIRIKPTYTLNEYSDDFVLSFVYRTSENPNAITYLAFTYPYTYLDLQNNLKKIDAKMAKRSTKCVDDIYYHRECIIHSLEGRRLDLLTISSYHNICTERETRLSNLFPDEHIERPFKFKDKKVIFVSARVHPGETPSSFVFNGFLNLLLAREDQMAIVLRRLYVFKLIPMLNPDGVAQGHYRMDTRGVNLNRVYLNPTKTDHPTIFAARTLIRYHHYGYNLPEEPELEQDTKESSLDLYTENVNVSSAGSFPEPAELLRQSDDKQNVCDQLSVELDNRLLGETNQILTSDFQENLTIQQKNLKTFENVLNHKCHTATGVERSRVLDDSGLFLYVDFHGHASKKGVFMYGNYFEDPEDAITCTLLPKLMSINNPHFHFTSCNFAEKNMYLVDKRDGMSREGSGRVAVYKMTGLVRSYTLECNYNSGRFVNIVPSKIRESVNNSFGRVFIPPKYTPAVFEEVGAALGPSILDLTGNNPNSRIPNSHYRSLKGIKTYLKLICTKRYSSLSNKPQQKENVKQQSSLEPVNTENFDPKMRLNSAESRIGSAKSGKNSPPVPKSSDLCRSAKKDRVRSASNTNNPLLAKIVATQMKPNAKVLKPKDPESAPEVKSLEDRTPPPKKQKKRCIKTNVAMKATAKQRINGVVTTIFKPSTKRLKVLSPILPSRPELGEPSNASMVEKLKTKSTKSGILCSQSKQKGSFNKIRKQRLKAEPPRSARSAKLKSKSRSTNSVDDI